jgi:DNA polymerase III epsilon subunit family exonuclease
MQHSLTLDDNLIKAILEFFPQGLCAFDLETTGLSAISDKIVEIGAVKITAEGKIHFFGSLVNPGIPIPPVTIAIHHITDEMVKKAPSPEKALDAFLNFSGDLPLLAHNAKFDLGFIMTALHHEGMSFPEVSIYDSCTLARKLIPKIEAKSYKLSNLCKLLSITLENHHRAQDDAFACLAVAAHCLCHRTSTISDRDKILRMSYYLKLTSKLEHLDYTLPPRLQALLPLLANQEVLEIKYKGGSLKNQFRPIKAIAFIPMPHGIVLYGICLHAMANKSFAISKIDSVRIPAPDELKVWQDKIKANAEKLRIEKGEKSEIDAALIITEPEPEEETEA